jgi:hypothetical protein
MTKKENAKEPIMVKKLKLFNSMTREAIIIADDASANYDVRLWQVVDDEVKSRAIRLEEIEAKRQKKDPE